MLYLMLAVEYCSLQVSRIDLLLVGLDCQRRIGNAIAGADACAELTNDNAGAETFCVTPVDAIKKSSSGFPSGTTAGLFRTAAYNPPSTAIQQSRWCGVITLVGHEHRL